MGHSKDNWARTIGVKLCLGGGLHKQSVKDDIGSGLKS